MIDFGQSMEGAWAQMAQRLFKPLDLGKWFALGVSAWLASFLGGGSSGSLNYNQPVNQAGNQHGANLIHPGFQHYLQVATGWGLEIWLAILAGLFVLSAGLVLLFTWLGARGQFMFLDNILHDRADVVRPWKEFSPLADSYFLMSSLFSLVSMGLIFGYLGICLVHFWPELVSQQFQPFWLYLPWFVGFLAICLPWIPLGIFLSLVRDLGIPLMYQTHCTALEALAKVWHLGIHHPLDFIVYLLLRLVLGFALVIVGCLAGCLTCCVGFIPYLSSVLLLPCSTFRLCFTLNCLAAWGHDLWPSTPPPPLPVLPPPLP